MSEISSLEIEKIKENNNPKENVIVASVRLICITMYYIAKDCGINIENKIFIGKKND